MSTEGENTKILPAEQEENTHDTVQSKKENNLKTKEIEKENKKNESEEEDKKKSESSGDEESKEETLQNETIDKNSVEDNIKKSEESKRNDRDRDASDKEGSEKEDKKSVPLLDQPLEVTGARERKKVNRFNEDLYDSKEPSKLEIPEGNGTPLGEIPRIDASISRFKNEDLKILHKFLFKVQGKTTLIKKNIKKFNGFEFKKDSEEYRKKILWAQKFDIKQLKSICEMLDLEKNGTKDEICERVVNFLLEPQDSGKSVGGRPKRTAAVRANNRGYSSHDSETSDEKHSPRSQRGKGKRLNLKDESSSESDEEFHPSDESEDVPRVNKRKRTTRRKVSSEEASDINETPTSDDSDDEPKKRKKTKKVTNSKAKGKIASKRGRKPMAEKKKKPSRGRKRNRDSSDEESAAKNNDHDSSSSEDEPLIKKAKSPQPPTDEDIKKYIKEILDGANLEEITMKTVCKQVYAHYPDFDLSHKKDFIKSTVKSLIST